MAQHQDDSVSEVIYISAEHVCRNRFEIANSVTFAQFKNGFHIRCVHKLILANHTCIRRNSFTQILFLKRAICTLYNQLPVSCDVVDYNLQYHQYTKGIIVYTVSIRQGRYLISHWKQMCTIAAFIRYMLELTLALS